MHNLIQNQKSVVLLHAHPKINSSCILAYISCIISRMVLPSKVEHHTKTDITQFRIQGQSCVFRSVLFQIRLYFSEYSYYPALCSWNYFPASYSPTLWLLLTFPRNFHYCCSPNRGYPKKSFDIIPYKALSINLLQMEYFFEIFRPNR